MAYIVCATDDKRRLYVSMYHSNNMYEVSKLNPYCLLPLFVLSSFSLIALFVSFSLFARGYFCCFHVLISFISSLRDNLNLPYIRTSNSLFACPSRRNCYRCVPFGAMFDRFACYSSPPPIPLNGYFFCARYFDGIIRVYVPSTAV